MHKKDQPIIARTCPKEISFFSTVAVHTKKRIKQLAIETPKRMQIVMFFHRLERFLIARTDTGIHAGHRASNSAKKAIIPT